MELRVLVCGAGDSSARLLRMVREAGFTAHLPRPEASHAFAARWKPDAVLVDLRGWFEAGLDVCRELRREPRTRGVPVLLILDSEEPALVLKGFDAGADDCAGAGSDPRVLAARIQALARRFARERRKKRRESLQAGPLRLDYATWSVVAGGRRSRLTPREFGILEALMLRAGAVVPRSALLDRIRRSFELAGSHTLEAHISNLRSKLGARRRRLIESVQGIGYLLRIRPGR